MSSDNDEGLRLKDELSESRVNHAKTFFGLLVQS